MGIMLDWVKANAKDGANIAEFEELEGKNTIQGVKTKEEALDIIKKTPMFSRALDSETNDRISNSLKKFKDESLPGLLEAERDKVKNELNPPQTDEQKRIAEMQKTIDAMAAKEKKAELVALLRTKAKEAGYPEDRAERFAVYGEQAEEMLLQEAKFYESHIKANVESEIKNRYGDVRPPRQSASDPSKTMSRADFTNLNPVEKSNFAREGGIITE